MEALIREGLSVKGASGAACVVPRAVRAVAVITEDGELDRIVAHLGLEGDFPKTKPARTPQSRVLHFEVELTDPGKAG